MTPTFTDPRPAPGPAPGPAPRSKHRSDTGQTLKGSRSGAPPNAQTKKPETTRVQLARS